MVEFTNLRTYIRHIEAVAHRSRTPFHVTCRTHVSSVIFGTFIIKERNTICYRQSIIRSKFIAIAVKSAVSLVRSKLPRYPVRVVLLIVEIRHKPCLHKQLAIFSASHSILEIDQRSHISHPCSPRNWHSSHHTLLTTASEFSLEILQGTCLSHHESGNHQSNGENTVHETEAQSLVPFSSHHSRGEQTRTADHTPPRRVR